MPTRLGAMIIRQLCSHLPNWATTVILLRGAGYLGRPFDRARRRRPDLVVRAHGGTPFHPCGEISRTRMATIRTAASWRSRLWRIRRPKPRSWSQPGSHRDFNLPDPVVIANGVVFALSTGENAQQEGGEEKRLLNTRPAVLYALDAKTGKELYNSGNAITGWVHFSGLATRQRACLRGRSRLDRILLWTER